MAGPSLSRLPQPSTELKKLDLPRCTTKRVQATLVSAGSVPRTTATKPRQKLQDTAPDSNPLLKPRDELFCPGYLTDDEIRHEIICSLNPNIDRTPAVLGHRDPAKVCIVLHKPPFGAAGQPLSLEYPADVHWERENSVRNLNRWRSAIFRFYMGLGLEIASDWNQLEIEFVAKACAARREQAGGKLFGKDKSYSWAQIAEDYNACFSGRKLPGCKEPRPARKRTDLIAQNCRMKRNESPFRCPAPEHRGVSGTKGASEVSPKRSSLPRAGHNLTSKVHRASRYAPSGIPKAASTQSASR